MLVPASANSDQVTGGGKPFDDEDRHIEEFLANGYTVIPGAIPRDLLQELNDVFGRFEEKYGKKSIRSDVHLGGIAGSGTIRLTNLLNRDPVFQKAFAFPPLLSFVEKLIGREFILQSCQTLMVGPGAKAQPLHTDDMYMDHPRPHRPFICNTIWAIGDFTEANGATRIVPGSHARPDTPRPTLAEINDNPREMATSFAAMEAGSILAIDGAIWHGAGENRTRERRDGLAISYCAGWMRQQENFQLSIAPSLARTFSARLQQLCGFGNFQGFVGNVNNVRPADLIMKEKLR